MTPTPPQRNLGPIQTLVVEPSPGGTISTQDPNHMNDYPPPAPPLASEKFVIDRKVFFLDLKENARGRFLKVTEDVGGRRDTIMLPREGFSEFAEALARLIEFEAKL